MIDGPALRKWIDENDGAQAALNESAVKFMEMAKEASPIGSSGRGPVHGPSGYFRRRFHIRPFRGGLRVYNRDAFAHLVEYGSANNPAYAPFRRTLRAWAGRATVNPKKAAQP